MVVRLLVPFHVAGDSMALAARVWRQYGHYFQDDGVLQRQKDAVYRDHGKTKTPRALNWPRHSVVVLLLLLLLLLRLPVLLLLHLLFRPLLLHLFFLLFIFPPVCSFLRLLVVPSKRFSRTRSASFRSKFKAPIIVRRRRSRYPFTFLKMNSELT